MKTSWLLFIALLVVPTFGCMKAADTMAAPGDYAYDDMDGGGGGGAYGGVYAEREFANDYRSGEADFKQLEEAPAEPAPEEAKPEPPIAGKIDEQQTPDDDGKDEPDHGRQMVYTATLQMAVYELDEAIEFAEDIPERYGGWIQARNDYQITLRVPAVRLEEIMTELSTLGLVLGKTLQAADVTAEYTDLESRIKVLEQLHEQLELLLKQAKTVEDSLKVRQELERVRLELESARTRFRQLKELVGFSTLTLYLSQRGADEALPTSNDPFPWVDELGVESTEYR